MALVLSSDTIAGLGAAERAGSCVDGDRPRARRRTLTALAQDLGFGEVGLIVRTDGVRTLAGSERFASMAERLGWTAAVVGPWPVGIDVENVLEAKAGRDAVLGRVVAVDLAGWHGLAGVWAAREAVLKALGRDLTSDPGGWRFGRGTAIAEGIQSHRVDFARLPGVVVAVAYLGAYVGD